MVACLPLAARVCRPTLRGMCLCLAGGLCREQVGTCRRLAALALWAAVHPCWAVRVQLREAA